MPYCSPELSPFGSVTVFPYPKICITAVPYSACDASNRIFLADFPFGTVTTYGARKSSSLSVFSGVGGKSNSSDKARLRLRKPGSSGVGSFQVIILGYRQLCSPAGYEIRAILRYEFHLNSYNTIAVSDNHRRCDHCANEVEIQDVRGVCSS